MSTATESTTPAAAPSTTTPPTSSGAPAGAAAAGAVPAVGADGLPAPRPQNASLYVGDLDPTVTEALLYDIFKSVGQVASIRVCRDALTRQSLGYAYVNFNSILDAERALDTLNYTQIKGRPCRIMWSLRDPSLRKAGQGNIFIKNLHKDIDNKVLYDTFSQFGNILSCKIAVGEHGDSKGYGFVHFETQEAADKAVQKVNNMSLNGKIVFVGPFVPGKERREKYTNLYVKNLPKSMTDEELLKLFVPFGEVTSAVVTRGEEGAAKGFGFVNFKRPEEASAAVDGLHGHVLEGVEGADDTPLVVTRHQKKAEREKSLKVQRQERAQKYQGVNLYIKNLDESVSEGKLREVFAAHGHIASCKIMVNDKGISRGFGFVCFSSPEEATKAMTTMNGFMLNTKPLYVALAEPKDIRKAKLEAQHAARQAQRLGPITLTPSGPMYAAPPIFYPQPGAPMALSQAPPPHVGPAGPAGIRGGVLPAGPAGPGMMSAGGQYVPAGVAGQYRGGARGQMVQGGVYGRGGVPVSGGYRGGRGRGRGGRAGRSEGLNLNVLVSLPPEERRQALGEALMGRIARHQPELAGKICGMLLDSGDASDVLLMIDSEELLMEKIQEAMAVLSEFNQKVAAEGKKE